MAVVPMTPAARLTRGWLNRKGQRPRLPVVGARPLTASAMSVDIRDRVEARRIRLLRQGWQQDAFAYSKSIPEVSFAYRFIANAAKRMRVFPAAINPREPDAEPMTLIEAGVPQQVQESCAEAMDTLGLGRIAKSPLMEALARNLGIPGEGWLVGRTDPETGEEEWTIRSIAELMVMEDEYKLREIPLDPQGQMGWVTLDPATTYIARMWVPDTEFKILADSPMRALLDTCEELLLLGRDVRAIARSRLAGAGLLTIPNGLSVQVFTDDNTDALSDDFTGRLAEMMMVPIAEEGVASSVVPGVIRGEADALAQIRHILIERPYSALAKELRDEAIGRVANGLDVPRAIVLGMEDVNHWGQWQISEDTFRHHLEPGVITDVDALTLAFMRPWLETDNVDPYWVDRIVMWYDPVEIVTHPDRTQDALAVHKVLGISDKALRETTGFSEQDAPSAQEIELRMVRGTRAFPPNVLEALFHVLDPQLQIPPIQGGGQIPGMGPKGAIEPLPPGSTGAAPAAAPPAAVGPPEAAQIGPGAAQAGPPASPGTPMPSAPAASPGANTADADVEVYAAGVAERTEALVELARASFAAQAQRDASRRRLSHKLTEIDSVLRARLHAAACASMVKVLEKAGARLRTTANSRKHKDGIAKAAIASTPNVLVASVLGRSVVAAMGFPDAHALLTTDWEDLRGQFYDWVSAAQKASLVTAAKLAGLNPASPLIPRTLAALNDNLDPAWQAFVDALAHQAESMLYNPMPNAPNPDDVAFNPATVVPVGIIRRVLGIAGGSGAATARHKNALTAAEDPLPPVVDVTEPVGRDSDPAFVAVQLGEIGTGADVTDMLSSAGMEVAQYTWEHNYAGDRPLEGHLALDGQTFGSFTDDVLENTSDWPDNNYYVPGDHDGCMCDFSTDWVPADESDSSGPSDVSSSDIEDFGPGETEGEGEGEGEGVQEEFTGMGADELARPIDPLDYTVDTPSLDQTFASTEVDETYLSGGAVNLGVREMDFADGTAAVEKEVATQDMVDREVLASAVGRAIGAPVVEVKDASSAGTYALDRRMAQGELAEDVGAYDRGHAVGDLGGQRLGVLDLLTDNTDNHVGNWVVDASDHPTSFDNGFTFDYGRRGLPIPEGVDPIDLMSEEELEYKGFMSATEAHSMVDNMSSTMKEIAQDDGVYPQPFWMNGGRPLKSRFADQWTSYRDGPTGVTSITRVTMTDEDVAAVRAALHRVEPVFEQAGHADWYAQMMDRFDLMDQAHVPPADHHNVFAPN